ncbi:MAG: hypothetical protein ACR2HR_07825 [Euzebya sp.]
MLRLERTPVDPQATRSYVTIGIRSFGKGIFHYDEKPGDQLGKLRFFEMNPGRLVVSNIKGWEGAIAVSTEEDGGCIASNRFLAYRPVDDRIDVDWARWFFLSDVGLPLIQRASPGSADRNRTLAIERFENLEIPLPPVNEQLSEVETIARASDIAVGVGDRAEFAIDLLRAIRASLALESSGTGWHRWSGAEVLALRPTKVAVDREVVYPMAGVYSFGRGLFVQPELEGSRTSYRVLHRLQAGQLVMSRLKAWEGALAVVTPQFAGAHLSPEFPTFDINTDVADPAFLSALVTSEGFWGRLKGASKGLGARKERVQAERLLEQEFALPSLEEQRRRVIALETTQRVGDLVGSRAKLIDALVPAALNEVFRRVS